ncbi:1-phosphatidylinositol 4,5-bisphosphate phosphodiesterase beta-1-like isoform X3 [Ruditapes philippinarum]|uniref:1-phosphatidylinositol 4,5-bisphosphate phosphodiesterase beta-1-like isoform X3 n=1 Tax=Ruditapes philippinarum TaxID=129788 RepID=UPI00295B5195|nr:1-phosphatidylinositol 4,5-bisphosphate phosphodiesterase beta-1-like isoform X3 [Ruditapes philippinarum]
MAGAKPAVHVVQLKPISVPEILVKGNKFIKWDDSSTIGVPVTLRVDQKGYILYWRDQNKPPGQPAHDGGDMDSLDISIIRDTRTGKNAKVPKGEGKLRESCMIGPQDVPIEDKTVTIVYGTDMVNTELVNFVCASRELAALLSEELLKYANNLLALNGSCLTFLEKAYTKLVHVLDVNGKIPVKNIIKMITKDNKDDRRRVEKAIEATGFKASKNDTIDPNKFTFDDFFTVYRHLVGRTECDKVFDEIGAKKKPYLTSEQFVKFLNNEQRDPRLNEILYPYYTQKQALELIHQYETKPNMSAKEQSSLDEGHFSQEGFLKFLMSEDNNLIPAEYLDLSQDMTQPLSHYFINSSHNTYLTGHQLTGKSSVEIYHQVLLSGCRCIELDCWDGKGTDEEPLITHGFTMCTDILFKDVIEAIAASAFKTSDYPVILSFENHCSVKQQAKMAAHCRNIFGDMLLVDPLEGYSLEPNVPLPSPELLKHKIIIKNRKKHFHKSKQKVTSPKTSNARKPGKQNSLDGSGEDSTVTVSVVDIEKTPVSKTESPESLDESQKTDKPGVEDNMYDSESSESDDDDEVTGLTEEEEKERQREKREKRHHGKHVHVLRMNWMEGTAGSEAEAGMEMSELVNYVQPVHFHSFDISEKKNRAYEISSFVETQATNLLKEYPVEFVNYNKRQLSRVYPRGTRVDSSNFMPQIFWNAGCQLVALNFQTLDLAMQLNLGIFEYNCKTGYILKPDFMRRQDKHFDPFAESTVDGIIAGTVSVKVISGQFLSDKKVGTYVEVDMYGLPTDTHRKKFRTKTVQNNGINPVYDEPPFVFRKVVLPNLAVIRIGVYEEAGKLIGHRVLTVEALRPGYRHIILRNENNQPLMLPTLFVYISVKDYVSDMHAEFAEALSNPLQYLSKLDRHEKQLEVLFDEEEVDDDEPDSVIPDSGRRLSNPSPIKPRRNGSLPNVFNNGVNETPRLIRTPSNPQHSQLSKKESIISSISTQSDNSGSMKKLKTRLSGVSGVLSGVPRMPSNENVVMGMSIVSTTKLNEPSLLIPTPLPELKKEKTYFKMLVKRDKDLEMLKKKNEKAQENMRELHAIEEEKLLCCQAKERANLEKTHAKALKKGSKTSPPEQIQRQNAEELTKLQIEHEEKLKVLRQSHAETFVAMCKSHFQSDLDVNMKHSDPIYEALRKVMDQNHKEHEQRLKVIHDQEVKDLTKRMDAQTKEEMRNLQKKHRDKQAFNRLKRENQKKHIDTVVNERQKLKEILDLRLDELRKKLDIVKEDLERDKFTVEKQFSDQFSEKCAKVREQHRHLLEMDNTSNSNSHHTTADGNEEHYIKTQL